MRAENIRLRDEIQSLRIVHPALEETADENRRLRHLLALQQQLPVATMASEIIAREWGGWVRSLTINRGRQDGIDKLAAVITGAGLVGRVAEVRRGTSIVQVLIDPASTVGALVVRTRTPASWRASRAAPCGSSSWPATGLACSRATSSSPRGRGDSSRAGIPIARVRPSTIVARRSSTLRS